LFALLAGVHAQCDMVQTGLSITPGTILGGQTADFKFTVYNDAGGGSCVYAIGEVEITLSLPASGYVFQSIVSPAGGNGVYFNWVYDPVDQVIIGTNIAPIGDGQGEVDVTIRVQGTSISSNQSVLNMNISGPGGDNAGNNSSTAILNVTTTLPIKISSFSGLTDECNNKLSWASSEEINSGYFEVEKLIDGRNFTSIGKVQASGNASGSTYSFIDRSPLSGKNHYRLRLVDKDGNYTYSRVLLLTNKCKEPAASVYPNPVSALQDANVLLKNFGTVVYGYLYDAGGKQLQMIKLNNGTNKVRLLTYASGNYVLKIKDTDGNKASLSITVAR
jgi:hypothetical protein